MPELPEVETMVRGIRSACENSTLQRFLECPCDCRPLKISPAFGEFAEQVQGRTVKTVFRRAKRIVFKLASERENGCKFIVFEPRMTGLALISDPPDVGHLRYRFVLKSSDQESSIYLWDRRGLGTLRLFDESQYEFALGPTFLGPDALDISPPQLVERLRKTNRAVKVALLDQKLVSGIGNLYAAEILHEARIHPAASASSLSRVRVKRIHTAMNRILREAIEYEGSTLNDGTYRNALNKDGSYQNKHQVYAKTGQTCRSCHRSKIVRIVQAQRATFFCRRCQSR